MKKSKALSVLLAVCLIFARATAVFSESGDGFSIKIVHTNDIHARVAENEKSSVIGVEKLGAVIDTYTEGADIGLVLDSGDLFHGQPVATIVRGESVAELINACGYDAMTVGNHDWNYGQARLKELYSIAGLKMLAGNVLYEETGEPFFEDEFFIKTAQVGGKELKVGVFGVTDPESNKITAPGNIEGITVTDPADYANKAAAELRSRDCDIVIALSHTLKPRDLARKVSGVDLWLTGHEHMEIDEEVTDAGGKTTRVLQSGYYLYSLSLVEISGTLDKDGNAENIKISIDTKKYGDLSDIGRKPGVTAVIDKINEEQKEILSRKAGATPYPLNGTWEDIRTGQTDLGGAIAGAYLLETGADVAFENAGGIRASADAGDITYGDIIGISPYGNYVVTKSVTGADLNEIIESALVIQSECITANDSGEYDAWPVNSGNYIQFGGMTVIYDSGKEKGERVVSVYVGDKPLDPQKSYTVATNNYLAGSSDYGPLAKAEETGEFSACEEALIKFFAQPSEKLEKSIRPERLFDISEKGEFFTAVSSTGALVYLPEAREVKLCEAVFGENNELLLIRPFAVGLQAGITLLPVNTGGSKIKLCLITDSGEIKINELGE